MTKVADADTAYRREEKTRKLVKTVESLHKAPGIISENTFWKFKKNI